MIDWSKVREAISIPKNEPEKTVEQRLSEVENKVEVIEQVVELPQEGVTE